MNRKVKSIMSEHPLVLVFDTETSGIKAGLNTVLSLSWQLIDTSAWVTVEEESRYFDWPSDAKVRVSSRAIEVNGLTRERLKELGTTTVNAGVSDFDNALSRAGLAVAHNATFDIPFVNHMYIEAGLSVPKWPETYDTMREMTDFCAIPGYYGDYKWPKLVELADCLGVDDSDIDYHQSAADVELTARCFREIVVRGY